LTKNGTRTDEAHTCFMTPMRRPYVLSRLETEGCIRCLKEDGGLSNWIPFLDGGKPFFVIPRCITRQVIQDAGPYKLERMVVGTYVCRDIGDVTAVQHASTCTGTHLPFAYNPRRFICANRKFVLMLMNYNWR
jgi:hypothetical protein